MPKFDNIIDGKQTLVIQHYKNGGELHALCVNMDDHKANHFTYIDEDGHKWKAKELACLEESKKLVVTGRFEFKEDLNDSEIVCEQYYQEGEQKQKFLFVYEFKNLFSSDPESWLESVLSLLNSQGCVSIRGTKYTRIKTASCLKS